MLVGTRIFKHRDTKPQRHGEERERMSSFSAPSLCASGPPCLRWRHCLAIDRVWRPALWWMASIVMFVGAKPLLGQPKALPRPLPAIRPIRPVAPPTTVAPADDSKDPA